MSPRLYPSILRGASSKKRKLSKIQHSPGNGKKRVDVETSKGSKTLAITKHGVRTGTTAQTTAKNPAIQLIPAMTRNQKGNRDSQPQQASTHQQGRKAVPLRAGTSSKTTCTASLPKKKQDFRFLTSETVSELGLSDRSRCQFVDPRLETIVYLVLVLLYENLVVVLVVVCRSLLPQMPPTSPIEDRGMAISIEDRDRAIPERLRLCGVIVKGLPVSLMWRKNDSVGP
ncbi:hypothetical protein F2Q69_00045444 [Brassica cretica]|uniref:Uncharacterized protein n=1 Tax=Brassica cretica TaxID=69181 RepID=A0A8S9NPI6_BRACR|nr:hypothetical protein F2Q69_00045444 [Brassica cretica]